MNPKFLIPVILMTLTSCTLSIDVPWDDGDDVGEYDTTKSYIPYKYVHTNPPDKLLPPPDLILDEPGFSTFYGEHELEAYADALGAYHGYLERYINSLEDRNGEPLIVFNRGRCMSELKKLTGMPPPPKRPKAPTYSNVERAHGSSLMVDYLGEIDRWIEALEAYHKMAMDRYNRQVELLRDVCE